MLLLVLSVLLSVSVLLLLSPLFRVFVITARHCHHHWWWWWCRCRCRSCYRHRRSSASPWPLHSKWRALSAFHFPGVWRLGAVDAARARMAQGRRRLSLPVETLVDTPIFSWSRRRRSAFGGLESAWKVLSAWRVLSAVGRFGA